MEKRVAIVTGASRGIGLEIAKYLGRQGRHVVCVARDQAKLDAAVATIKAEGGSAEAKTCDMGDGAAIEAMVEAVAETHKRLDILVNCAGITKDGLMMRMSNEDFDAVINTNLRGVFIASRTALRPMMRGKWGRIVNIGSVSGIVGNAGQANYAAAKAGVIGLTKTIAKEMGAKGITANVVAPGFIQTDMTANLPKEVTDHILELMATPRLGEAADIASCVSYVTSDAAGFLTGQTICVDGGLTMC